MSSSNPMNLPRAHIRAQSDKIIQAQTLHESKTVASCVDTTNKLMKVDVVSASGSHGLATAANQELVINASLRDINNTGAIGDGSSQASAMCLGYDRSNGQGRSLLVDANGALETNVTINAGHGLATEAKQDDIINATNRAINNTGSIGDGSTNATTVALGYDRTNGKGRALLVDDGGRLDVNCLGNTVGDGSGDVKSLHLDGSGNVQTNVVNTVNVNAANSINSGITNDPANSIACGLRMRTDIALASTETFVSGNSDGSINIMNDPLNFDTATTILNQSIADGDSVNTSVVDLGTEIDRDQLGNLEFFVDNSNSVPLTIKAIVSPDDGSNYYDNVNGKLVSTSGGAFQFNQEDIITRGIKYFLLQVTNNHGGGTASTVTIKHTNYK